MNIIKKALYHFRKLPDELTYGEKYEPAMKITNQEEAVLYFEICVEHCMRHGKTREEAEKIERANIGYWAGYYDRETAARVYEVFDFDHPLFGAINNWPTPEEAFAMGKKIGVNTRTPEEEKHWRKV